MLRNCANKFTRKEASCYSAICMAIAANKMYSCMAATLKKILRYAEYFRSCLANLTRTLILRVADLVFKNQRLQQLELPCLKNSKIFLVFIQWNLVLLALTMAKIRAVT
jgi:hypothetical protein